MKKILLLALLLCGISQAWAVEWTDSNGISWTFDVSGENATNIHPTDKSTISGEVVIPGTVYNGETALTVTGIGNSAFEGCTDMTDANIPESVTSIGSRAFYRCSSLTNVTIPSGITSIGSDAFSGCSEKPTVNVIVTDVVAYCSNAVLQQHFPDEAQFHLFNGDGNEITEIAIPEGVTSINSYAFANCSSLRSVTIPSSVTTIGQWAFKRCSSLSNLVIPESVVSIDQWAFWGCSGLLSMTFLKNNNTSIGWYSFDGCESLKDFYIKYNGEIEFYTSSILNQIGSKMRSSDWAAHLMDNNGNEITELVIPEGVTSIGDYAFRACTGLTSVTIPSSVTSIGNNVFYDCYNVTNLNVIVSDIAAFSNNIVVSRFDAPVRLIDVEGNEITEFVIPEGVTSIGQAAFRYCSSLTSVTIPSSVTSIGQEAFQNCSGLSSVTINATTVPSLANTNALPMVVLVPESAFEDYLAADVWKDMADRITIFDLDYNDYSASVSARETASGLHANIGEGNLRKVVNLKVSGTINSYDVMVIRNKMLCLRNLDLSDATIVANNYEYYSGCKSEDNKIGDNMFRNLKILSFKAPRTVTTMGFRAFDGCSGLKDVTLYEGLKNIGNYAFNGCGIERLTVPAGVVTIGQGAFAHCTNLQEISLPDGLEDIGSYAFQNCRISEITIPEGVKRLRSYTFCGENYYWGSNYLTKVNLPSTLEVIEQYPFGGQYTSHQLTELILPVGLKRIEGSLGNNGKITEIRIPPMMEYIAAGALQNYSAIKDYYVYVVDPININMSSFANYTTATLHVPTQSYNAYYWNTQWSQFANLVEFNEPYSRFYLQNDYTLEDDKRFDGEPDADFQANSGFIVDGEDNQDMGDIHVIGNGTDAATIIDDGNITAQNVYFDITVNANRWYFFAFPFRVKVSDIVAPGYFALRWYDGVARAQYGQGGWKDFTGEYLEPGIGYIFQCNTNGTLHLPTTNPQFDGQDKDSQLEVHHSDNNQHASWNFMGNPWLSYFDINDCGFDAPFTIWNGSGYDAYRPGDDDYMLHPFQAFFVQTPGGNNGMHFGHGDRYTYHQGQNHQTAAHAKRMAKGINPKRLRLDMTISNGTDSDRTRVVFNADKQNAYEVGTDAAKFMTTDMPQLYTLDGTNTRYAINERPYGEVKLGFNAPKAGAYTIAIQRMDEPMLLRDLLTGTTVKISEKDYTFDSGAGTFDSRFILVPDNGTTGIAQLYEKTGVSVIGADHGLYINGADKAEVNVYSTTGAAVAQRASNGFLPMQRGTYLVTVNGTTTKVMVR